MKSKHKQGQIYLTNRNILLHEFTVEKDKLPAVLFLPDLTGVTDSQLETAGLLAQEGFHVFVPDLFSDEGAARYCMRMFFNLDFLTNTTENPGLSEIHEIIHHIRNISWVDKDRLGIIGQCLTGGFALHCALRNEIKAPVIFHHSLGVTGSGMPEDSARQICKNVQGHFVHLDPFCPRARVNELKEQLGVYLDVNYYDWLPHGIPHFFRLTDEGRRSYTNMVRFLKMQLAS